MKGSYRTADNKAQIDWELTEKEPGKVVFSACGEYDGGSGQCIDSIAKAYPADEWIQAMYWVWKRYHLNDMRDVQIPATIITLISSWQNLTPREPLHHDRAKAWLVERGLKMRITLSDTKPSPWETAGHHYRVTITREQEKGARVVFDWWGSQDMAEKHTDPQPYDILACISSDITCPDTFDEFCSEYGDSHDSIKAIQTFKRASRFTARLKAFFTEKECETVQTFH